MTPEPPAGTVLLAYRGSIAHNMYVPGAEPDSIDDVDLIGIVIGPLECYFGLREWGSRGTREIRQGVYDCVYYEIRKAVSLLLKGNPNIVSLLWLRPEHYLRVEPAGRRLIENRHLFAGRHVYDSFAKYAQSQLEKMESRDPEELREYLALTEEAKVRGIHPNRERLAGERRERPYRDLPDAVVLERLLRYQRKGENLGYLGEKRKRLVLERGFDSKNAAHSIRLLRMCKEFLLTGEMRVYRDTDAAELLDIKRGRWKLDRVKAHAHELFEEIREARDRSPLPDQPDAAAAERLLMEILRGQLWF